MKPFALAGALIAAVVGAAIWAGIAILTEYEIGWVAWGVGALVGFGAVLGGGHGKAMALICAGLALFSIFCGKMFAVQHYVGEYFQSSPEEFLTTEIYEETQEDIRLFAELESEEQWPQFMVERSYSIAEDAGQVEEMEVEWFRAEIVPDLRAFHAQSETYEQWRERRAVELSALSPSDLPLMQITLEGMGPMDLLFGLLGGDHGVWDGCEAGGRGCGRRFGFDNPSTRSVMMVAGESGGAHRIGEGVDE